jgi:predicted metalloprotease with PDZ domain
VDKTNYPNIVSSYYPYGAAIALALELELRTRFKKTLDDLMQASWKKFGKPEVPYTVSGLQDVLASVTGDKKYAENFFNKYIYGHDPIDYNILLAPAGFILKKTDEGRAWIGNTRGWSEKEGLLIESNTLRGTPIYAAGLDIDDKILGIDNQDVRTVAELNTLLGKQKPAATVEIRYLHRGEEKKGTITLGENPAVSVVSFEQAGKPVTEAILTFRKSWLNPK